MICDTPLNRIGNSVSHLTGRTSSSDENLLSATISMVDGLTKTEIYQRLATLLQQDHGMTTFSIYELNNQKQQIIPILVDGQMGTDCRWSGRGPVSGQGHRQQPRGAL